MTRTNTWHEGLQTLRLAAPIAAGFVGQMLLGLADTVMVGRLGVVPLAACAFATTLMVTPLVAGFGVLSVVSVRVSHAAGASDWTRAGDALRAGLVLAFLMGLAVAFTAHAFLPNLGIMGQKPEVNAAAGTFFLLIAWSVLPAFLTTSLKCACEALGHPWVAFWIMMASVILNIVLNAVLIFGMAGFPALGLEGAGIATLVARVAGLLAMVILVARCEPMKSSLAVRWRALGFGPSIARLARLGLPVGGMNLCEVSGFAFGSIMMGWISVHALAAHQVAITCAGLTFMIPLGIGQAVSMRISQARGAGDADRLRPIMKSAILITMAAMALAATTFLFGGTVIASTFTPDPEVIQLAAQLIFLAGVFQIVDGAQAVFAGILRGFEDTTMPMLIGLASYWVVALPLSALAAFPLAFGAQGIWFGFVAGLATAALLLGLRVRGRWIARTPVVPR